MNLAHMYTLQLDPSLVVSAATLSTEPLAAETGSQKESLKEHIDLLERVSSYLFNEKKNDFLVPAPGKLSEDFSSLSKEIMHNTDQKCQNLLYDAIPCNRSFFLS